MKRLNMCSIEAKRDDKKDLNLLMIAYKTNLNFLTTYESFFKSALNEVINIFLFSVN